MKILTENLPQAGDPPLLPHSSRIVSLDILRGLIMLLMVVDHAREYANLPAVSDPVDIQQVSPALFLTRWISHFCAPVFVLLAGVSARLVRAKMGSNKDLSRHLWKRGLVLILLEFTILWFAWTFNWQWRLFYMQVIWVLGVGMILLAQLIYLPPKWLGAFGLFLVFAHNLFDKVYFAPNTPAYYLWSIIHQKNVLPLLHGYSVRTTYPLIPLVGVMALGYWLGELYQANFEAKKRPHILVKIGFVAVGLFLILRIFNLYGDPNSFAPQSNITLTLMSLLNATKYPTSLQFLLMTLGPILIFLAWVEKLPLRLAFRLNPLVVFGRVPMFYYIAHLYLLHIIGLSMALLAGYPWGSFNFTVKITGMPEGFHLPLWGVYAMSFLSILLLYPLCYWYGKWRHRSHSFVARYI
jgi:uncharacterized membrane protein